MKQPSEDRITYLTEMRRAFNQTVLPELSSDRANEVAEMIDRTLIVFVMEAAHGDDLNAELAPPLASHLEAARDVLTTAEGDAAGLVAVMGAALSRAEAEPTSALEPLTDAAQQVIPALFRAARSGVPGAQDALTGLRDGAFAVAARVATLRDEVTEATGATGRTDGSPAPSSVSVTDDQLTVYLRERYPDLADLDAEVRTVIPGGRSKETVILDITGGEAELPAHVVLRKDKVGGLVESRAADEYTLLQVLDEIAGIPSPSPLLVEPDEDRLGGTFMLVALLPGKKMGEFFPDMYELPSHRTELATQIAAILARIHSVDLDVLADTSLSPSTDIEAEVRDVIEEEYGRRGAISDGPPSIEIELAHEWLLANIDAAIDQPALVHGDFGFSNLLADGERLTGVLDWELAAIRAPASDLGQVKHMIEKLMPWSTFTEIYRANGGLESACVPRAVDFYAVLTGLRATVACMLAGYIFRTGLTNDYVIANAGYDAVLRGNHLLGGALNHVLTD